MSLSTIVQKFRETPRSTKIAGGLAATAMAAAGALALVAVNTIGPSDAVPPTPTPVVRSVEATPGVSATPKASATPLVEIVTSPVLFEENSVIIRGSDAFVNSDQERRMIEITHSQNFVNYLADSGLVDQNELESYEQGGVLQLPIEELADEMFDLIQSRGYGELDEHFGIKKEDAKYLAEFAETEVPEATVEPTPTAEPTRVSEEVIIDISSNNAYGQFGYELGRHYYGFINAGVLLDYLFKEGVLTPAQNRVAVRGDPITVSGDKLSVAIYKLLESRGENYLKKQFGIDTAELDRILYHFDESLLESGSEYVGPPVDATYNVVISNGGLETVVTDEQGNTTRVKIGTVDAEEFLDYLLSQNKITVEQRNAYGESQSLELSLQEVVDVIDWGIGSDKGFYVEIDKEGIDYLEDKILPIFQSSD